MSPEEWLASQATPATPTGPVAAPGMPGARVTPTEQAARDQEAIPILMQELQAAQVREEAGNPRAAGDVVAIVRELARKGVNVDIGALPSISAASAPAAPASTPVSPEAWLASQTPAALPALPAPSTTATGLAGAATRGLALPAAGALAGAAMGAPFAGVGAIPGAIAGAGAATLAGMVGDPIVSGINSLFGTKYTLPTDAMEDLLTRVGVAQPRTAAERIVQTTAAGASGGAGGVALGKAVEAAATGPVARGVGQLMATTPGLQTISGGTAGAAGGLAKEAGAGPLGQIAAIIGGAFVPSIPAATKAVTRQVARQFAPPAPAPPRVEPTFEMPPGMPEAPPAAAGAPPVPPAAAAPTAAAAAPTVTTTVTTETINNLVQRASGKGFGSTAARDQLADLAQVNVAAKEAADRLGIQLPADVFSDNPQVRAAAGLTRSLAAGEAEAAWRTTVSQAVDKADDVIRQFDAQFIEGAVAPAVVSQKIKDSLIQQQKTTAEQAKVLYDAVDLKVPEETLVTFPTLKAKLAEITSRLGAEGVEKNATLKMLNKMVIDADAGKVPYGRLKEEKTLIGDSIKGVQNDYSKSTSQGRLKEIYGALAKDQLDNVEKLADAEVRQQLRSAHLLTKKEKALGQRIISAFGEDIEGSLGSKLRSAIISGGKGDTGDFNRLLKIVPEEYRRETVATALASASRSARGAEKGSFGFSEFADIYPKLRANPPVYKTIVDTLGKDSADVLRDLYEVSKRITEARAKVLTTGKANQAFGNPEGLIGKIMESTITQRIVTTVTGLVPGGGAVAPDIIKFMSTGAEDRVKAAGKLFADEAFQKLAVEAATKAAPSAATLRRTAMSQSFQKFADAAKLPKGLDARIQFLQSAAQTGRQFDQENQ